jgi:adhesin/invasin
MPLRRPRHARPAAVRALVPADRRRRLASAGVLLVATLGTLLLAGCQPTTETPTPDALVLVQGNFQTAAAGAALPTPVVVRVHSVDGSPVEGVPVAFAVAQGGGAVDPASAMSDASGEVKTRWTLGPNQDIHALQVSTPGVAPITVSASGITATDLLIVQGNNQSGRAGSALSTQIVLRVIGSGNVPIPGVPVGFAITAGSGAVNPPSATTNAAGEVTVRWTLGAQQGLQTVQASALNLSPVLVNATAN